MFRAAGPTLKVPVVLQSATPWAGTFSRVNNVLDLEPGACGGNAMSSSKGSCRAYGAWVMLSVSQPVNNQLTSCKTDKITHLIKSLKLWPVKKRNKDCIFVHRPTSKDDTGQTIKKNQEARKNRGCFWEICTWAVRVRWWWAKAGRSILSGDQLPLGTLDWTLLLSIMAL